MFNNRKDPIKVWWNAHACTNKHTQACISLLHASVQALCLPEISLSVVMTTVAGEPEDKWEWMAARPRMMGVSDSGCRQTAEKQSLNELNHFENINKLQCLFWRVAGGSSDQTNAPFREHARTRCCLTLPLMTKEKRPTKLFQRDRQRWLQKPDTGRCFCQWSSGQLQEYLENYPHRPLDTRSLHWNFFTTVFKMLFLNFCFTVFYTQFVLFTVNHSTLSQSC